jgi:hypothetical protein
MDTTTDTGMVIMPQTIMATTPITTDTVLPAPAPTALADEPVPTVTMPRPANQPTVKETALC